MTTIGAPRQQAAFASANPNDPDDVAHDAFDARSRLAAPATMITLGASRGLGRSFGVILAMLFLPAIAHADAEPSKNPQASRHFHAGLDAYGNQDYAGASTEFQAAYKLDPVPSLLWSWAQSERLAGHCDRALPLYRKYLYADISATQVAATREKIATCEKDAPPPPSEGTEASPPAGYRWYRDPLADGLTAAGVVGVAVGIVYFAKASSTRAKADDAMFLDDFKATLDEATTQRRVGAVSLSLGVGLAVTGVAVYVLHGRAHRDDKIIAGTDGHSIFIGAHF